MKLVNIEVKLYISERTSHKFVTIVFETDDIPELLSQICDVGFYDDSEKIYYPPHRIYEITVL